MAKASPAELALHTQVLGRDPRAPLLVLERLGPTVIRRLQRRYPWIEAEVVHDAAVDACLTYAEHPERYNPSLLDLEGYLVMSAGGDIKNLVRRLARERPRQELVEKRLRLAEHRNVSPDPAIAIVDKDEAAAVLARLGRLFPKPEDVAVLQLMMQGVRATAPYVDILGVADRPREEQRRLVKQAKDRIKKRLQRAGANR